MIVNFPNQPPELDYGNREYKRLLKLDNRSHLKVKQHKCYIEYMKVMETLFI